MKRLTVELCTKGYRLLGFFHFRTVDKGLPKCQETSQNQPFCGFLEHPASEKKKFLADRSFFC
jgi:hypothetical protein